MGPQFPSRPQVENYPVYPAGKVNPSGAPKMLPADLPLRSTPATSAQLQKDLEAALAEILNNPQAAEDKLVRILSQITQKRDEVAGTQIYSESLANAISAMWEADELYMTLNDKGVDASKQIAASFRSPVGEAIRNGKLNPTDALETYMAYAKQSLVVATGETPLGSDVLYGLARIYQERKKSDRPGLSGPKMRTLLLSSVKVNPENWRSQNELGITFARKRQWEQAEAAFAEAIRIHPRPETWHNLAQVYQSQGLADLSKRAEARSVAMRAGKASPTEVAAVSPEAGQVAVGSGSRAAEAKAPPQSSSSATRSVTINSAASGYQRKSNGDGSGSALVLKRRTGKTPGENYTAVGTAVAGGDVQEQRQKVSSGTTGTIKDLFGSMFKSKKDDTRVASPQPKSLLR